jgi:hypothetical protein
MFTNTLIKRIEEYAAEKGIPPARITKRAVGNHRLWGVLKSGSGTCTLRIAEDIIEWMGRD